MACAPSSRRGAKLLERCAGRAVDVRSAFLFAFPFGRPIVGRERSLEINGQLLHEYRLLAAEPSLRLIHKRLATGGQLPLLPLEHSSSRPAGQRSTNAGRGRVCQGSKFAAGLWAAARRLSRREVVDNWGWRD